MSIETSTTDDLAIKLFELREHMEQPYLSKARREQIGRVIAYISFELSERDKEE